MTERKKRALCNSVSSIAAKMILALSGFILPKFILQEYGSTVNGMVSSISQFLSYAQLVELGVGNAAMVALYKPLSEDNQQGVNAILSKARKQYIISGILYSLIVMLIALIYPLLIADQLDMTFVFSMVCIIGFNGTIDYFIIGKYKVLLVADQRYYVINSVKAFFSLVLTIGSVLMLINHQSLEAVKALAIVTHLGEGLCIAAYTHIKYKNVDFHETPIKQLGQQKASIVHQIACVITYNTDLIVLTLMLSSDSMKEVSVYGVYSLVSSFLKNFVSVMTESVYDGFGQMYAQGKKESILNTYRMFEFLYFAVLFLLYSCDIVLILAFIGCYTKGIDDANYIRSTIAILFVVKDLLSQTKDAPAIMIRASGSYKQTQGIFVAEAAINLASSLILVYRYGMIGVLIGTIISHIFSNLAVMIFSSKNYLQGSLLTSLRRLCRNAILMVVIYLIETPFISMSGDWLTWIAQAVAVFLVNAILYVAVNIIAERKFALELIKNYLKR